jgi:bacterioferritin-associated ferredoxin
VIVCLCHAVSSAQIEDTVEDGARSVDDVADRTRAGTTCGACREDVHEILVDAGFACGPAGCSDCPRRRRIPIASPYVRVPGEAA